MAHGYRLLWTLLDRQFSFNPTRIRVQRSCCRKSGRFLVGSIQKLPTIENQIDTNIKRHPIAIQFPDAKQSQIRNHWRKTIKGFPSQRHKLSGSELLIYTWDIWAVDDLHVRNEAVPSWALMVWVTVSENIWDLSASLHIISLPFQCM